MLSAWLLWMFVGFAGPQPMRIVINIPAFRLDVYINDSVTRTMPIAPGMSSYRTPRASFAITSVQWNPWWIPPKSPWAAKEKPTPPGPGNPMGRVKLNFQPLYFLHGTPFDRSIGTAASHGCIRLKNADAIELARLTLHFGMRGLTPDDIEALAADTVSTRTIQLEEPVPIEIRYDLVEVRNGRVSVYRDVYGLASKTLRAEVYAALAASGLDTMAIDSGRVRALVRRVKPAGNSIELDSILRRAGGVHLSSSRVGISPTESSASPDCLFEPCASCFNDALFASAKTFGLRCFHETCPRDAAAMIATLEASLSAPAALAYQIDPSLDSSIDALVADCCAVGESLDDATDAVATRVRRIAPTDLSANASDWEERWRAYYDFYDHAVARTIRSYVERSIQAPRAHQLTFDKRERPCSIR